MRKLSTGADSTLGEWKKLVDAFFGADSPQAKFINDKIDKQGEDMEVIADEGQMLMVLGSMK